MKCFKNIILTFSAALCTAAAAAQTADTMAQPAKPPLPLPAVGYQNRANLRSEFMSYTIRATAASADRDAEWNYIPVENYTVTDTEEGGKLYTAQVAFPDFWADRIVIVHTEGGRNSHRVIINGRVAGSSRDSGTPSEFEITRWAVPGINTVTVEVLPDTREPESSLGGDREDITSWFLYSQPRTRIWDYIIATSVNGGDGEVSAEVIVRNDSPSQESFALCFDVFSPSGRVEEYGIQNVTIPGNCSDTLRLKATIYGAAKRMWSAESPNLYTLTLFVRKGGRILEYVPVKFGFGATEHSAGSVYRNGKPVTLNPIRYNASTAQNLKKDMARFKKEGFNALWPDSPQPYWFYDLCDAEGMYVIDQANIHTSYEAGNKRVGGCLSNDPTWLPEYMERVRAMFSRSHNHPCIIAWSTGGDSGNGYNMYKAYMWLRGTDPTRPVVYPGAGGEWNSDLRISLPPHGSGAQTAQ